MHLIVDDTAVGEVTGVHFLKGFEDRRVRLEIAERIQFDLAEADARIREEHRLLKAETFQEIGRFRVELPETAGNCPDPHRALEKAVGNCGSDGVGIRMKVTGDIDRIDGIHKQCPFRCMQ